MTVEGVAGDDQQPAAVVVTVTGLWEETLGIEGIGVDDDFIAVGGDSIGALTLLEMVAEVFGVEISPRALFDEVNTVRTMADLISGAARSPVLADGGER